MRFVRPAALASLLLVSVLGVACGEDDDAGAASPTGGGSAGGRAGGAGGKGAGAGGTLATGGAGGSAQAGKAGAAGTGLVAGNGGGATGGAAGAGGGLGGAAGAGQAGSAGGSAGANAGQSGAAGTGGGAAGAAGKAGSVDAPTVVRTYKALSGNVLNPERGFHRYIDLLEDTDLAFVRAGGSTLVYSYVHLDAYRTKALPAALLSETEKAMQRLRDAGLKVVLRFAYNEGPYPNPEPDASKAQVLAHLDQLAPLLQKNADVIAVLQAGFIGAWGEWHTSTNGLDTDAAAWQAILQKILDVLPASRMTQVRTPVRKQDMFGGTLDPAKAFSGEGSARVGHMNDCFLASDDDNGTYEGDIPKWKGFVAAESKYVVVGGETCADNPPRSSCVSAKSELASLRFSYLNRDYHPDVIAFWQADGCYDSIAQSLGYRLALTSAALPETVRPGGAFPLAITLENGGYAAPFNARPVSLVLDGPGGRRELSLPSSAIDPRRWLPGTTTLAAHITLPGDLAPGAYTVALWLPDEAPSLRDKSAYAIHLANDAVWSDATGLNTLGSITVSATAPGTGSSSAVFAADGVSQQAP